RTGSVPRAPGAGKAGHGGRKRARVSQMMRSVIRGVGAALPRRVMTNADFEGVIETSAEWIVQRTGIRQRHIAAEDETTVTLGEAAARAALDAAGLSPDDIDLVVLATSTPNNTFPASAVEIQHRL